MLILLIIDSFEQIHSFNYSSKSYEIFVEVVESVKSNIELTDIAMLGLASSAVRQLVNVRI